MTLSANAQEDGVALRRERRHVAYERLRQERPALFVNPPGAPFEILFQREDQDAVATASARDYGSRGIPTDGADIGVVYEDRFIRVVRDAVRFGSGATGPYVRVVNASAASGCAILPVTTDGRVVLVSHFRHASRRWHWEIPRGFGDAGETPEVTARRELQEELGLEALRLEALGPVHIDAAEPDELFLAQIEGSPVTEADEGIGEVRLVPYGQFLADVASGSVSDAYTLAAVARANALGLLPPDPARQS